MLINCAYLNLYLLCRALTDCNVVLSSDVSCNSLVKLISRNLYRLRNNDTAHRNYRNIGSSATDVNYHISNGTEYINSCAKSCRNGLLHKIGLSCSCLNSRIYNGSFLNLADARGHAYYHSRMNDRSSASTAVEILYHLLRYLVFADNAILKRTDDLNIGRVSSLHCLSILAYLCYLIHSGIDRYVRRLVQHYSLALNVNEHRCRSEINAYIS